MQKQNLVIGEDTINIIDFCEWGNYHDITKRLDRVNFIGIAPALADAV